MFDGEDKTQQQCPYTECGRKFTSD